MSETPEGRTLGPAILHYNLKLAVLVIAAAAALVAYGKWPGAIGVLAGPVFVVAWSLRLRKSLIRGAAPNSLPNVVVVVGFLLGAIPGLIMIFVGYLTGDHFAIFVLTAGGTFLIGISGLMIAMARSARTS